MAEWLVGAAVVAGIYSLCKDRKHHHHHYEPAPPAPVQSIPPPPPKTIPDAVDLEWVFRQLKNGTRISKGDALEAMLIQCKQNVYFAEVMMRKHGEELWAELQALEQDHAHDLPLLMELKKLLAPLYTPAPEKGALEKTGEWFSANFGKKDLLVITIVAGAAAAYYCYHRGLCNFGRALGRSGRTDPALPPPPPTSPVATVGDTNGGEPVEAVDEDGYTAADVQRATEWANTFRRMLPTEAGVEEWANAAAKELGTVARRNPLRVRTLVRLHGEAVAQMLVALETMGTEASKVVAEEAMRAIEHVDGTFGFVMDDVRRARGGGADGGEGKATKA